jgi:hypothetical protein
MLPLMARLEFSRRYSRARDVSASRFAHVDVWEFLRASSNMLSTNSGSDAKDCAQPGMAERSPVEANTSGC